MKQRYVYIIRRGESIRAVETRSAHARTLLGILKGEEPDRPSIGDGEDAIKQWFAAMQEWDAEWHLERHPIGPPIPTDKDKPADKPAADDYTPAADKPAAPDGERDSATRRAQ